MANDALKFTLEFLRVDGTKSGFSIAQSDYRVSGPYDGMHYLFGFLLNTEMVSSNFFFEKSILLVKLIQNLKKQFCSVRKGLPETTSRKGVVGKE